MEFVRELDIVIHSLKQHKSELLAKGELRHLRRAAEVFGFHLAPLDMRQHSSIHEQVVAELLDYDSQRKGYSELLKQNVYSGFWPRSPAPVRCDRPIWIIPK